MLRSVPWITSPVPWFDKIEILVFHSVYVHNEVRVNLSVIYIMKYVLQKRKNSMKIEPIEERTLRQNLLGIEFYGITPIIEVYDRILWD